MMTEGLHYRNNADDDEDARDHQQELDSIQRDAAEIHDFRRALTFWLDEYDWGAVFEELRCAYSRREEADCYMPGRLAFHMQRLAETQGWVTVLQQLTLTMRRAI